MELQRHSTADCRHCGERIWYGVKAESTCWKVFCQCLTGCGREWRADRISRSTVDSLDDVYRQAERQCERVFATD